MVVVALTPLARLHAALDEALVCCRPEQAPLPPAEANRLWYGTANLLRGGVCELAEEAALGCELERYAGATEGMEPALRDGRRLCADLTSRLKMEAPSLYAVVKHSLKRNGDLRTHRGCERAVAEIGLLISTHAVLTMRERDALLLAARPLTTTASTSRRLPSLVLLCRGFFSPGYGPTNGWRSRTPESRTALALAEPWGGAAAADAFARRLSAAGPDLQQHSRALRAALPFLELPRRVWRRSASEGVTPPDAHQDGAAAEAALTSPADAATLLIALATSGPAGAEAASALREWACGALEADWREAGDPLAATPPLARGSAAAVCMYV